MHAWWGRGGKWWEGENKKHHQPPQKKRKEKSESGLFLSSLPSIQWQQGRSTTVASRKAQKKPTHPDKHVLADGDQSGQEAGDSSNTGSTRPPL